MSICKVIARGGRSIGAAIFTLTLAAASHATTLTGLSSTGADGNLASLLVADIGYGGPNYVLNTDNGQLTAGAYASNGNLYYSSGPLATFAIQSVAQNDGPNVNVFNFSTFGIPQGYQLTTIGSAPAALLSQTDTVVAGNIIVRNANSPGASDESISIGAFGGGNGANGWGYIAANTYGFAGSGGGGGLVSPGTAGDTGVPQIVGYNPYYPLGPIVYYPDGGSGGSAADLSLLQGGGGGGLGGHGCGYCGGTADGGYGGGALLLGTAGNFTVTSTGSIIDNGAAGQLNGSDGASGGAGGGGAGGELWFDAAGIWENDGLITAEGGAGASDNASTFSNYTNGQWNGPFLGGDGSGGFVNIDPSEVINNGTIDVSGGGGNSTGLVDSSVPFTGSGLVDGNVAPEPGSWILAALPALLAWRMRNKRALPVS